MDYFVDAPWKSASGVNIVFSTRWTFCPGCSSFNFWIPIPSKKLSYTYRMTPTETVELLLQLWSTLLRASSNKSLNLIKLTISYSANPETFINTCQPIGNESPQLPSKLMKNTKNTQTCTIFWEIETWDEHKMTQSCVRITSVSWNDVLLLSPFLTASKLTEVNPFAVWGFDFLFTPHHITSCTNDAPYRSTPFSLHALMVPITWKPHFHHRVNE